MRGLDRRQVLSSFGLCAGSVGLLFRGRQAFGADGDPQRLPWSYAVLDSDETAERAYALFANGGGCSYAVFTSIAGQLAERIGGPYRSFPFDMLRYGNGGVAGLGSICGTVTGAAAALSLTVADAEDRIRLTQELGHWYEETELPFYAPRGAAESPRSVARSLLCKDSVAAWSRSSGLAAEGSQRMDRCRRLTTDVARKTVQLLNAAWNPAPKPTKE